MRWRYFGPGLVVVAVLIALGGFWTFVAGGLWAFLVMPLYPRQVAWVLRRTMKPDRVEVE